MSDSPGHRDASPVILVNVFTVKPEDQQRLLEHWQRATDEVIRHLPGFLSATIHRSLDGTKVVNYAQWETREAFNAMLRNPERQRPPERTRRHRNARPCPLRGRTGRPSNRSRLTVDRMHRPPIISMTEQAKRRLSRPALKLPLATAEVLSSGSVKPPNSSSRLWGCQCRCTAVPNGLELPVSSESPLTTPFIRRENTFRRQHARPGHALVSTSGRCI